MAAASQSFDFRQWWNREREFHPNTPHSSCLYRLIRVFLFLAVLVLVLELIAGLTSWNFSLYAQWLDVRADYISPPVQVLADVCFVLFLLQSVDRAVVMARSVWMNVAMEAGRRKEDVEQGKGGREQSSMVVIQIPAKMTEGEDGSARKCKLLERNGFAEKDGDVKLKAEQNDGSNATSDGNGGQKQGKESNAKPLEPPKDYIHVKARRGQAANCHTLAERVRIEKVSERMKFLQDLVPGCNKVNGKAAMLDEIINHVQSLQRQVEFLSMKLATVNPHLDSNDMYQRRVPLPHLAYPTDGVAGPFSYAYRAHLDAPLQSAVTNNALEPHCSSLRLPPSDGFAHSQVRGEKISDRMKLFQDLVPNCNKATEKAVMLDEIINYVQALQCVVEVAVHGNAKQCKSGETNGAKKDDMQPKAEINVVASVNDSGNSDQKQDERTVQVDREAIDSHSLAKMIRKGIRKEIINERMKILRGLVPGCNKVGGRAARLDEIINYVRSIQQQVEFLSMTLASVNPHRDFNMMHQQQGPMSLPVYLAEAVPAAISYAYQPQQGAPIQSSATTNCLGAQHSMNLL